MCFGKATLPYSLWIIIFNWMNNNFQGWIMLKNPNKDLFVFSAFDTFINLHTTLM